MPKLKNWCFTNGTNQPVKPEIVEGNELEQTRLIGYVFGDKRYDPNDFWSGGAFQDGHRIVTSPVREINLEEGYVITRSGTKYELDGPANKEYEEWLGLGEGGDQKDESVWEWLPRLAN